MPLHVEIVTQQRKIFDEQGCSMVVAPGTEGEMGILPHHTPLLTTLRYGELRVKKGGAEESFIIYGGVMEVRPDKVVILADEADLSARVNIRKIEEAKARIATILEQGLPPEEQTLYLAELRRAELAIDIYRKTRSRAGTIRILSDEALDEE
jgi:F-type H+-transporting ATPase subunit epsilon